jgi:hypothetical protein
MLKGDRLDLLSFCDNLKPQLLVDILVSVSKKHPELPMFNSPDWTDKYSSQPTHPHSQPGTPLQQQGQWLGRSKQKPKPGIAKKVRLGSFQVFDVEAVENDDPDAMPASWPRAGNGMYAKLPPEQDDLKFLMEENDEAFSHFMVDIHGKHVAASRETVSSTA